MLAENKRVSKEYPLAWKFMISNRVLSGDYNPRDEYLRYIDLWGSSVGAVSVTNKYNYSKDCYSITPEAVGITEPVLSMMEFFINNKEELRFWERNKHITIVKDCINNKEYSLKRSTQSHSTLGRVVLKKCCSLDEEWCNIKESETLGLLFAQLHNENKAKEVEQKRLQQENGSHKNDRS